MRQRSVSILGSTGSIGKSALDVARHYEGLLDIRALSTHANIELLHVQAAEFRPASVCVTDPKAAEEAKALDWPCALLTGMDGLCELAQAPVDVLLNAVVGAVGLHPLLRAIDAGNTVAVANKEPFVMAGRLVMERAQAHGVRVLPVDSEHSAIFQCMQGTDPGHVQCVHLTASGGPFYRHDPKTLDGITPEQATNHPTWDMGAKISVDSATLMNKGLEVIEAMWLFQLEPRQIEVVIHPQSIIHSLVEFTDGNILAHLGVTDMKFPILYALTYPERVDAPMDRLDLTTMRDLTFDTPDFRAFPCLALARAAADEGGTAPAILNAANEEAVAAFRAHRLPFLGISELVARVRDHVPASQDYSLESVLAADAAAREHARAQLT